MYVFGAGASFDSDPHRLPGETDHIEDLNRPPLASRLFEPAWTPARDAAAAFPRAAPLLMRLRESAAAGEDIEQILEGLQAEGDRYAGTAIQLLALRAYLARLLTEGPREWLAECQGQTNYVLALDEAARWRAAVLPDQPIACLTFNYDDLLESACQSVFGRIYGSIEDYGSGHDVRLYKPHGSVTWRQLARWGEDPHSWMMGASALHYAIEHAAELEWTPEFKTDQTENYQDGADASNAQVWLPALSIPVRNKSIFTMPEFQLENLREDLACVTTLVAVGWRARERHFLQLLEDHMPSAPARLVVVADRDEAARETVDNLWETGRFGSYVTSTQGFSHFTRSLPITLREQIAGSVVHHRDILTGDDELWVKRSPGHGLSDLPEAERTAPTYFVDL